MAEEKKKRRKEEKNLIPGECAHLLHLKALVPHRRNVRRKFRLERPADRIEKGLRKDCERIEKGLTPFVSSDLQIGWRWD